MVRYSVRDIEDARMIKVQFANIDTGEYDSGIIFEPVNDDVYYPWKGQRYVPTFEYDGWDYYSDEAVLDCMNERGAIVEIFE